MTRLGLARLFGRKASGGKIEVLVERMLDDKHYFGVNWERDLPVPTVADLRNVVAGDPSPASKAKPKRVTKAKSA